ncbi:unnamed protein product, partial [Sphenostylis stenocarpa]
RWLMNRWSLNYGNNNKFVNNYFKHLLWQRIYTSKGSRNCMYGKIYLNTYDTHARIIT